MLTQLKNGNWIDLAQVCEVETFQPVSATGELDDSGTWNVSALRTMPLPDGGFTFMRSTIRLPSRAEAEAYRDELAGLVNAAQVGSHAKGAGTTFVESALTG
jgi:hypothetical protein